MTDEDVAGLWIDYKRAVCVVTPLRTRGYVSINCHGTDEDGSAYNIKKRVRTDDVRAWVENGSYVRPKLPSTPHPTLAGGA